MVESSQKDEVVRKQSINVAKSRLQHDRWLATRAKPDPARTAHALAILDRDNGNEPDPGDELPEGYVSISLSPEYKRSAGTE